MYEKMWGMKAEFSHIIADTWDNIGKKRSMGDVAESVDKEGKELKVWNKTTFGNVNK